MLFLLIATYYYFLKLNEKAHGMNYEVWLLGDILGVGEWIDVDE